MSITQREDTLFEAWRKPLEQDDLDFVMDGVVCEDAYAKSDPKILFVLKEPNGNNDGDIRKYMSEGGKTWMSIAYWAYGIQCPSTELLTTWEDICKHRSSKEQREKILRSVCAMNLKKSPGGGVAKDKEIDGFVKQYKTELQTQYDIYNPDLTICCGKSVSDWGWVRDIMEHNDDWKITTRGVWWYQRSPNKYVIDWLHPAARCPEHLMFYGLVDAVNEIYGNA